MASAYLLTPDEIRKLPRASVVWIEFWNGEEQRADSLKAAIKCADGTVVDEDTCVFDDYERDMRPCEDGYWRFWSAMPTQKQREETGWPHDQ